MTTATATPDPEPFSLSEAEVDGIAGATGVRADIVRSLKGEDYASVRANAAKLADLAPSARVDSEPEPRSIDNTDKLAAAIRQRLGGA
ncbi:hypothetical protein [Nocardiopsis nanhaiensis]